MSSDRALMRSMRPGRGGGGVWRRADRGSIGRQLRQDRTKEQNKTSVR
jgi:hypothetical protein